LRLAILLEKFSMAGLLQLACLYFTIDGFSPLTSNRIACCSFLSACSVGRWAFQKRSRHPGTPHAPEPAVGGHTPGTLWERFVLYVGCRCHPEEAATPTPTFMVKATGP
jgi:hypothetical protein